ncbi:MAG TPA: nucleotide excision repair endonuclease, partial [Chroococcales cyanobacterium]
RNGKILYVGKATSLKSRVNSYFRGRKGKDPKKLEMLAQTWSLSFQVVQSALEAALVETDEIKRHNPPYNINLKRGRRQLAFYSRDFSSLSERQDREHPVGPFSNALALDSFLRLAQSLQESQFDPLIFFDTVPIETMEAGFAIFCQAHAVDRERIKAPRTLMALAVQLFRQWRKEMSALQALEDAEATSSVTEDESNVNDVEETDDSDDADDRELTPEEVAGKFYRLLVRSARLLVRSKQLTRLLNCRMRFTEASGKQSTGRSRQAADNRERTLTVRYGRIVPEFNSKYDADCEAEHQPPGSSPWVIEHTDQPAAEIDLDCQTTSPIQIVDTYDRMSVLLQELTRLSRSASLVSITPRISL